LAGGVHSSIVALCAARSDEKQRGFALWGLVWRV